MSKCSVDFTRRSVPVPSQTPLPQCVHIVYEMRGVACLDRAFRLVDISGQKRLRVRRFIELKRNSMLAAGTIRIGGASGIPAVLREFGVDPTKIIAEAGVLPSLFGDPENTIPFAALGHLMSYCARVTKCNHFGLLVGAQGGL